MKVILLMKKINMKKRRQKLFLAVNVKDKGGQNEQATMKITSAE